jgi:hypothetical protein
MDRAEIDQYRLLLQKLEDQLRLLVGLCQHRDTRLFQHLGLSQIRRFLREVRILNGAARLRQVLAVDCRLLTAAVKRFWMAPNWLWKALTV